MSFTNRWAIRQVAIARFFDIVSGALKVKLDTLKTSGLENTSAVVYATGSRGNPKLVGFSSDRAAKFTLQDALFTNEMIALLTGNDVVTGATPIIADDIVTVVSNSATLSYTPSTSGALISVNKLNADGTLGTALTYSASSPTSGQYGISNKTINFNSGEVSNGSKIQLSYYTVSGSNTKQLKASTDKFAGTYKLVLDVLVRDFYTKQDFAAQIVVPNAKVEDNWNLQMNASGEAAVFDIPIEALKPSGSTDLYTMNIYDEDELA